MDRSSNGLAEISITEWKLDFVGLGVEMGNWVRTTALESLRV